MRKLILIITVFVLILPRFANAACEGPPAKLCSVFFNSDIVAHVKVEHTEIMHDPDDPEGIAGWRYHLKILKTYRGDAIKAFFLTSINATDRLCLATGKEYIIFAHKDKGLEYITGNYCGEVQGVDGEPYSLKLEKRIEELLKIKKSFIEGEVRDKNWKLTSGAVLTVTCNELTKKVTVDENGKFYIKVDPGTYTIGFPKNLRVDAYSTDGLDHDPPNGETVPKSLVGGQCMQILLIEGPY